MNQISRIPLLCTDRAYALSSSSSSFILLLFGLEFPFVYGSNIYFIAGMFPFSFFKGVTGGYCQLHSTR